jgi:hypothetical protein
MAKPPTSSVAIMMRLVFTLEPADYLTIPG